MSRKIQRRPRYSQPNNLHNLKKKYMRRKDRVLEVFSIFSLAPSQKEVGKAVNVMQVADNTGDTVDQDADSSRPKVEIVADQGWLSCGGGTCVP